MNAGRHVVVAGRVQGVGFRAWTEYEARKRNLAGWVRNRRDGTVEAVFSGPDSVVRDMIAALHRGPPSARVDSVAERDADQDELSAGDAAFAQLPTA
ncbi:MAG: acylphosphatase [Pseudorhodoplanes sp.]